MQKYYPMTMSDQPIINLEMPLPHIQIRLVRANNTFFVANRGGFKTTRGISFYNIDCIYEMPRSTGILVSPSYEHLGDNTLNPLFNALNEFGFEDGVHYVIGTKPPEEWESPYIKVQAKKYDHIISWHNGSNQMMISMAKKGSANGISAQWGIFDEIKLMDEKTLMDVIFPVFRGNESYFSESSLFMSKFFATDKLADPAKIKWILKKREMNDHRKIDIIITLQMELNRVNQVYNEAGKTRRFYLKPQINALEVRLAKLRSNLTFYVEANHEDTQAVLGKRWYQDKVKNTKEYELKIAIRNEDPIRPEDGFYPDFDRIKHTHTIDSDYDLSRPLILASDYQHSVTPICIAQITRLHPEDEYTLNYINEVSTVAPEGLDAALELFINHYQYHRNKVVYYVYDQTATGRRNDEKPPNEKVKARLVDAGWLVLDIYTYQAPTHFNKYTDTQHWLQEKENTMAIRINSRRCPFTILSIESAPARMKNGKTEKDKRSEQVEGLDQRETTHFSDVFDMINHAVIKLSRISSLTVGGSRLAFR
jgi:hypothetical protein